LMSLRDLVANTSCDPNPGLGSTSNPLARLFHSFINSSLTQEEFDPASSSHHHHHHHHHHSSQQLHRNPIHNLILSDSEKNEIRARSLPLARHLFPNEGEEFVHQQIEQFLNFIDDSDDLEKEELLQGIMNDNAVLEGDSLEKQFNQFQLAHRHPQHSFDYNDFAFDAGPDLPTDWTQQFWENHYREQSDFHTSTASTENAEYVFTENNPLLGLENPFEAGVKLFREGTLDEAVLAFEAHLQKIMGKSNIDNVNTSDTWRWLGTAHAENDQDKLAIKCLIESVKADRENLEALVDLGVSFTNELEKSQALTHLELWLSRHPDYQQINEFHLDANASELSQQDRLIRLFHRAAEIGKNDTDVYTVLGVLYNLSRNYTEAEKAFKTALDIDPSIYSLWNKLGATQANSTMRPSGSKDAVYAYRRAIELKPNYVRAWVNMGISYANQGIHEVSAKYYLKALSLNSRADHVWSYLKIAFNMMNRPDLAQKTDCHDVNLFRDEFQF